MQADILAWAVPATFLTFGIGFALLGRIGAGLYAWSGCFCLAALAYALTVIPTPPGAIAKPLFEDSLFLLALSGANVAFASRAGRRPRYGVIAAIVGASLLGAYLALRLTGSAQFEIFSIQAGCSLLMLLAATTIRRRSGRMMDQVLFWLCILVAASLGLQNLVFLSTPLDQPMTVANWRDSPWAFVFQFSGAVTGVLIAFAILAAIGLDVIEHHRTSSDMDALTLVRNRRGFERRVAELRRAAGPLAPGAIILADLDFFKRINDRHGHEAGDAVLCGFATLLERMVGTRGCVCRFGGEEFAVFLANSDLAGAQVFAQSLQGALRAVRWPFALADLRVTASFGVVALAPGEPLWDAASRADTLLYVAKSHGRDRVIADAIAPASAPARTAFAPAS